MLTYGKFRAELTAWLFLKNLDYHLWYGFVLLMTILSPLVWFRFIDDIFFIWTGNKDSLDHFISFTQNYSKSKNMKSKIKFEIHLSTNKVHFLDVTVFSKYGKLRTTLFTKPTDSHFNHFYLISISFLFHFYLIFPSITSSKKYTQRTVYSSVTYMLTKIGLPVRQQNLV